MGNQSSEATFCVYRKGKVHCRMIDQLVGSASIEETNRICNLCLKGQLIDKLDDMQNQRHVR